MPTAAPTAAREMGVHHTGDSGAHLEIKGKGEARKVKVRAGDLRTGAGEREETCGNSSSSDSGLVCAPQPFPSPLQATAFHSARGSWGLWFLFCLGGKSSSEEGAGGSSDTFQCH